MVPELARKPCSLEITNDVGTSVYPFQLEMKSEEPEITTLKPKEPKITTLKPETPKITKLKPEEPENTTLVPGEVLIPLRITTKLSMIKFEIVVQK